MPAVAERTVDITANDQYLYREGTQSRLYEKLGAHFLGDTTHFAVWAPNAVSVAVVGDFNGWDPRTHPMKATGDSGIWQLRVPEAKPGSVYKFHVVSRNAGFKVDKADPYAFRAEEPPRTGSMVWDLAYEWHDGAWMADRKYRNALDAPCSVYEVHLGSWRRSPDNPDKPLGYRELAAQLADYCKRMNFTHVELMPIMEHPFYGSWGYQCTGYFAPSTRYGTPQDFMHFVDTLHQAGIGVILDWVPSHFPWDQHGLGFFDGSHLYEHSDPRQGHHPDWASAIFNYGRNEVRAFLASSARFWLEQYHADGLRVDAVASMLYLDYGRKEGEWIPNRHGGRENLEAIEFLRFLTETIYRDYPDTQTIAEESTAWPQVSRPTYLGGLGFGMKWNMGWMHDTLDYFKNDPVFRKFHHDEMTFSLVYAFHENFVLPLSHDEVVHGKGSLLSRMPGDLWQKFANMRLLYSYMYAQPAKKLLFMGGEFGQWAEWSHDNSLEWHLLQYEPHRGLQKLIADLNATYRAERALHELDCDPAGFEWIDGSDSQQSMLSFMRRSKGGDELIAAVFNFTPMPRHNYRVGVPRRGYWREIFNSDSQQYGGADFGNLGGMETQDIAWHGKQHSLNVIVPPLGAIFFKSSE